MGDLKFMPAVLDLYGERLLRAFPMLGTVLNTRIRRQIRSLTLQTWQVNTNDIQRGNTVFFP